MRYVSEQFKEKQNQLIRPPLKLYFEVCSDINQRWFLGGNESTPLDDFDYAVAPVKNPSVCTNEYYYAVVGDEMGVDDPNRMCAPDNTGVIAEPNHLVPFGVMKVVSANEEALIGNSSDDYRNFIGGNAPYVMSFKGGLIPDVIRVETRAYLTSSPWVTETTIYNPDLLEEIEYTPSPITTKRYRFYVKNTTKGGRFQFNWVRGDLTTYPTRNYQHIIFENNRISSVSINEETDLTSQALPTYEMTVTCLDINGEYSPDSSHWNREFSGGMPVCFKAGYEAGGETEYVALLFGSLSKEPTYDNGKITFYVSIPMALSEGEYTGSSRVAGKTFNFPSKPNASLNVGDVVDSVSFNSSSVLDVLFDSTNDIFADSTDENNSLVNYYGSLPFADARQLVANALGCYIKSGIGTIDLYNTNNVQYGKPVDYLTRYDQVKATLESQPKVVQIDITRNENTLSANYFDVEAPERITIPSSSTTVYTDYFLPIWAMGKATVIDAQSTVPGVTVTLDYGGSSNPQKMQPDGTVKTHIGFRASAATTIKPIVRFYNVDNTKYQETESASISGTETYTNDNELITNTYISNKVKRVARFMSDVSNQYEVDVVQDLRYELGDVIRLETEKNVFKTCVVTALQFNLPGSKGHVTCRKIFSLMDSAYAVPDPQGSLYVNFPTGGYYYVGKNDGMAIFGTFTYSNRCFFYGLGFSTFTKTPYGAELSINKKLVDLNGHEWGIFFYNVDNSYTTNNPCVIELPDYDPSSGANANSWGAIELIKALYNEQKMTPPVDYTCTLVNP